MKRLIINADDFGLTAGVNAAIVELHNYRHLTSATLMARAAASDEAMALTRAMPALGVGCHIVLVDGEPVLPARQLPTLVNPRTGRFRATLGLFVRDILLGAIAQEEIVAEAKAQIDHLHHHGVQPTHVDTHKHTHIFPHVLAPLLKAARQSGITAIRNPFEPEWSLAATAGAPNLRRTQVRLLRLMRAGFLRRVAEGGFTTPDGAVGVLATGTLNAATLASLLRAMPAGCWELVTHPGYNDRALATAGTRLLASRLMELQALRQMTIGEDLMLLNFGQLTSCKS